MMKMILSAILAMSTILLAKAELKEGKYSWFRGGGQSYLTITKSKDHNYTVVGDCYYGVGRKYGPNMGDVNFTAPLINGKILYIDDELTEGDFKPYKFILKVNIDGSFDVDEEGETPFGHNASFYGHYTSDDLPSFPCKKASTFVEHSICKNVEIAKLDKIMAREYSRYKSAFFFENNKEPLENKLNNEQQKWLKSRNECSEKKEYKNCLIRSYKNRIKTLEKQFNNFWKYD